LHENGWPAYDIPPGSSWRWGAVTNRKP